MRLSNRQQMVNEVGKKKKRRPALRRAVFFIGLMATVSVGYQLLKHPDTPLPRAWNPVQPLRTDDPITLLTTWKLDRAAATSQSCLAALDTTAALETMPDLEESSQCHIRGRVDLRGVGQARMNSIETRCAIALRLAMWERHTLQPAANEFLRTSVTGVDHFGSYSCRPMRTSSGGTSRMSSHATAEAIDVAGFVFADGRNIRLANDWNGSVADAAFLRAARDGACKWFKLTLSPDYNSLHSDHFHLQSKGWGLCR